MGIEIGMEVNSQCHECGKDELIKTDFKTVFNFFLYIKKLF